MKMWQKDIMIYHIKSGAQILSDQNYSIPRVNRQQQIFHYFQQCCFSTMMGCKTLLNTIISFVFYLQGRTHEQCKFIKANAVDDWWEHHIDF